MSESPFQWTRRTIEVSLATGVKRTVRADGCGPFAVHEDHRTDGWVLTHEPTGRKMRSGLDRMELRALAEEILARTGTRAWEVTDHEQIPESAMLAAASALSAKVAS